MESIKKSLRKIRAFLNNVSQIKVKKNIFLGITCKYLIVIYTTFEVNYYEFSTDVICFLHAMCTQA